MRINKYDGQASPWEIKLVLEDRCEFLGVLLLCDSPLQSVTHMQRIETPEVDEDDDIAPEVSKHLGDYSS